MRWCSRCVLPDTRPSLAIEADGVCNACHAHASKPRIDWAAREKAFLEIADESRGRGAGWDCVVPVSGGKDSTWQVVRCLEYGLKLLAVSWRPPGRTTIGQRNLDNLIGLGVDHIDFSISPGVERRFTLAALERFGDPAIPMHMALFGIPTTVAARFGIPLVVWGENSALEYGGSEEERRGVVLDGAWLRRFGVTHGTTAADWISADLTARDLAPYRWPEDGALAGAGVRAVFLGSFLGWDPQVSLEVARANGFHPRPQGPKTGLYDFADIDDDHISVHHHLKWYKFGFTRLFDNCSIEIRNGRMTRDEAIEIIRARGDDTPHEDIERFCAFLEIPTSRFFEIAERFRSASVWCRAGERWEIPGFPIPDWSWT